MRKQWIPGPFFQSAGYEAEKVCALYCILGTSACCMSGGH